MKLFVLIGIAILAFIGGDYVLDVFGYHHRDFTAASIFRVHPLFYVAVLLILYYFFTDKIKFVDVLATMRNELIYIFICLSIITYCQLTENLNPIAFFLDALLLPALISILLKITNIHVLYSFRKWVYGFFFLNAGIAIIEKITGIFIIPHNSEVFFDFFRSSALLGHPLNNALIMSVLTILLFLATKNNWLKLSVLIFGMLSIFCFGARGALVGVFLGITINITLNALGFTKYKEDRNVANGIAYLITFAAIIFSVISFTSLGDRIVALAKVDDSAEARVDSFNVMDQVNLEDLIWTGITTNQVDNIQYLSGVEIIENFYIIWILRFGVAISIIIMVGLIYFLFNMMKSVGLDIKLPILFTLIVVASSNNSLSTSTLVVTNIVIAYYVLMDYKVVKVEEITLAKSL